MRRTAFKLLASIAIGVAISAIIAMACALLMPGGRTSRIYRASAPITADVLEGVTISTRDDRVCISGLEERFVGCTYTFVVASTSVPKDFWGTPAIALFGAVVRCEAGWPWRCLVGVVPPSTSTGADVRWMFWRLERGVPRTNGPFEVLTVRWGGAIADSACFAAVGWGLLPGLVWMGPRRRLGRGLCVACGYDLTGNPTGICPECGKGAAA